MFINRKSRVSSSVIAFRSIPRAAGCPFLGRLATLASRRRRPETFPRVRSPLAARPSRSERTRRERKQRGNIFHSPSRSLVHISRASPRRGLHAPAIDGSRRGRREDGCLSVRHPTRTARVVPRRRRDVRTGRLGRKRIRIHTLATGVAVEVVAKANMVVRRTSDALTTCDLTRARRSWGG